MEDEVYFAAKGSLKLKGVDDSGLKKKKKKKKKDIEKQMEASIRREATTDYPDEPTSSTRTMTQAEHRFMERRRKMAWFCSMGPVRGSFWRRMSSTHNFSASSISPYIADFRWNLPLATSDEA
ncbi:protein FAM32A-like isoform X1 [Homarus americanus]|uniref:protein FAM32A-like isoform X1 n=1 Tax=Homarus americanus TaxID=6706 RepID=UPI001C484281|nr:protein FAM32A-like isoform X1 [Homarus americanus]